MKKIIHFNIFMVILLSCKLVFCAAAPQQPQPHSFESAVRNYMVVLNQCYKLKALRLDSSQMAHYLHKPLRAAQRKYRVMTNEERKVASQIMLEYSMNPKMVMPRKIFYRKDKSMQAYRCRN